MNLLPWQTNTWQQLIARKQQNHLPHALLLVGAQGLGKKQFALQFAHLLLCGKLNAPCEECHTCHLFRADSHPDLLLVEPEQPGQMIKIDQIRSLVQFVSETALQSPFRVIIIYPANNMNAFAANALLKTLEEPAPNILIILISDPNLNLPATIKSRCQKIIFETPQFEIGLSWLKTALPNTQVDLGLLLMLADGAPLLAKKLAEENFLNIRQEFFQGLQALAKHQLDPLQFAVKLQEHDVSILLKLLLSWLQDLLKLQIIKNADPCCHPERSEGSLDSGDSSSPKTLLRMTDLLVNYDYQKVLTELAKRVSREKLLNYFDHVKKINNYIINSLNLNRQLLLEELFILWVKNAV